MRAQSIAGDAAEGGGGIHRSACCGSARGVGCGIGCVALAVIVLKQTGIGSTTRKGVKRFLRTLEGWMARERER
eukprot:6150606-Pleurochrysis_carterae.AAC.1